MKVKVSSLTGIQLDYAVALCKVAEGRLACGYLRPDLFKQQYHANGDFNYSTNPGSVLRILTREKIAVGPSKPGPVEDWVALGGGGMSTGATPAIAILRNYVEWNLGSEVEIPEELK